MPISRLFSPQSSTISLDLRGGRNKNRLSNCRVNVGTSWRPRQRWFDNNKEKSRSSKLACFSFREWNFNCLWLETFRFHSFSVTAPRYSRKWQWVGQKKSKRADSERKLELEIVAGPQKRETHLKIELDSWGPQKGKKMTTSSLLYVAKRSNNYI